MCGMYFGRRKTYYLIGTLFVLINYFLVFGNCLPCDGGNVSETWIIVYYSIAASLFNVGW
jgi:hypothetical protein